MIGMKRINISVFFFYSLTILGVKLKKNRSSFFFIAPINGDQIERKFIFKYLKKFQVFSIKKKI